MSTHTVASDRAAVATVQIVAIDGDTAIVKLKGTEQRWAAPIEVRKGDEIVVTIPVHQSGQ
jgi:hypothetical protein